MRGFPFFEQWRQRSVDQLKQFDECVDRIKQMSWGDLLEGGVHLGGDLLLNGASLCILKKLPSAGGRFVSGLKKFAEAGRAEETVAAANKGLSIANQVSMDTAIGVKLATEYGTDGAAKILKIIEQHPEILRQEGKTVIEVVQEVGNQFKTNLQSPTGIIRQYHDSAVKMEHVFSPKHKKRGIMKLGKSEDEILSSFKKVVDSVDAQGLLKQGTNQIKTKINGFEVEVKVHIIDGIVRSLDGYVGYSNRVWDNSITWL